MTRILIMAALLGVLSVSACGKRGPLSFPEGTQSLPPDPSQRDNPPG
ncbi:MAG: lipoprotein [Pseudomonadota bacterium]